MQQRATVIKGSGVEWLRNVITANLIESEAIHKYEQAISENDSLSRENQQLAREKGVLEGRLKAYQQVHRAALDGKIRCWRLWMWDKPILWQGVVMGLVIGSVLVTLAYEIARWSA